MTRVARIIKKHNWKDWTICAIKECMLWYVLNGGYLHVRSNKGDAILLSRKLQNIGQRILHDSFPDGHILWIEFFYYSDPLAAVDLILKAISRYENSVSSIAFHDSRNPDPASYEIYSPRFALKLVKRLWAIHLSRKFPLNNQPRQKRSLS